MNLNELSPHELSNLALDYYYSHFMFYKPHAKQLLFHEAGLTAKERLFLAGNRTGKTFCASGEGSIHLTGNYPNDWGGYRYKEPINMWVASLSREATRDILQKQYYLGDPSSGKKGLISENLIVNKTYGAGVTGFVDTVWVKHASGGVSTVSFKSYDQGREKFQGTEKHLIHLDEEPPRDVYEECLMRTMATRENFHGMMMLTMTPLMGMTDMVLHFTQKKDGDKRSQGMVDGHKFYVVATWDDNPHLPNKEKEILRESISAHELEAREKGIPSLGSGMVYPIAESLITGDPFEIPEFWPRGFAIDFGWSPSPTAAVFFAHDRDNNHLYAYAEYATCSLTPQQHALELMKQGADWMPGVYDPAGQISSQKDGAKLVNLYREAGIRNLSAANNSKEIGVQTVLQKMQQGKLTIFKTLNKTLTELRMYSRDEEGIIKKGNDHHMDCIRYFIMSGIGLMQVRNLSKWQYPLPMQTGSSQGMWMGRV